MPCCAALHCSNRTETGFRLFRLPRGNRAQLWKVNIGRENIPTNAYICEVHFSEDQYENNRIDNKKLLKWNAVPSIFENRYVPTPHKLPSVRHTTPSNCSPVLEIPPSENIIPSVRHTTPSNCSPVLEIPPCENIIPSVRHITPSNRFPVTPVLEIPPSENIISEVSQDNIDNIENVDESDNIEIADLKRKLKAAHKKIEHLTKLINKRETSFEKTFNPEQVKYFGTDSMKGFTWSDDTINKGLRLYMSCGKRGYEEIRRQNLPYPCLRTLQKRIQHFKCTPGVLGDVLNLLKAKIDFLNPKERECTLLVDEMSIKPGLEYDSSIGEVIGKPTMKLSGSKSSDHTLATHALVFMLAGITTRWKQTIAYEFTANSYDAEEMKKKVFDIVTQCSSIGVTIKAIVSDMGPQNRSLWRSLDIVATRHGRISNFCIHNNEKLYLLPDSPHILKNMRNTLVDKQVLILDDNTVKTYNLPSNEISVQPVQLLFDLDKKNDLKIAPYLKKNVLHPSHFEKMNVSLAVSFFNNDIAAGIKYYIMQNKIDSKHYTTAWFLGLVFRWFSLMNGRHPKLGLHTNNTELFNERISLLKDFIEIIRKLQVGKQWLPWQSGILLATQTALDIQTDYLENGYFKYILLGRLSQDSLENFISIVRSRRPAPGCKDFKTALRLITLSQNDFKPEHGSYSVSDAEYLIKFCNTSEFAKSQVRSDNGDDADLDMLFETEEINFDEEQSLYYLAGCILYKIKKNFRTCTDCYDTLITTSDDVTIRNICRLCKLKCYKTDSLVYPTLNCFNFIYYLEQIFRNFETKIVSNLLKINTFISKVDTEMLLVSDCHNITIKLVKLFFKTRVFFALKKHTILIKNTTDTKPDKSSKTMARKQIV